MSRRRGLHGDLSFLGSKRAAFSGAEMFTFCFDDFGCTEYNNSLITVSNGSDPYPLQGPEAENT
jgi:hypothetical protein